MATATITATPTAAIAVAAAPKRAGFFKRMLDAMIEARMRQAAYELNRYRHLIPQDEVAKAGYRVSLTADEAMPFTR